MPSIKRKRRLSARRKIEGNKSANATTAQYADSGEVPPPPEAPNTIMINTLMARKIVDKPTANASTSVSMTYATARAKVAQPFRPRHVGTAITAATHNAGHVPH